MNYYEQFYDDLEFCDPDEDLYHRRGHFNHENDPYRHGDPYGHDDPYQRGDPYYHDDPYYRDDPYAAEASHRHGDYHRGDPYYREDHRDYRGDERGEFRQDRQAPPDRGRGYRVDGRGHRPPRGHERSRGGRGRGQSQDHRIQSSMDKGRGRGFERKPGDRVRGIARGNLRQQKHGGGINFVKAGSDKSSNSSEQELNSGTNENSQIRFDYRSYQNEPSESEKEVDQAMEAYTCQLGFGYGYGPRTDLIDGDQPEWLIGSDAGNQPPCQVTATSVMEENMPEVEEKPKNDVKKAMVSPALNFVKAKSEFHSIDVAFHETEELKPKANSLSVNFGNKRVGLGFGVSQNTATSSNISTEYHAGLKEGCNTRLDARFRRLQEAVKERTLPNKNGIEIMHMAVDKVKMKIDDDVGVGNRTPNGQARFLCRLLIDGVYISQGQSTTKKGAKHDAYQNALKVFNQDNLTVKEISQGNFELRQKGPEFKVPFVPGQGQKPQNALSQTGTSVGKFVTQSTSSSAQNAQSGKSVAQHTSVSRQATFSTYSKPKMVFHQPTHPLNNKPLEFKQAESTFTMSSTPEALATKLLNFVKEGADLSAQHTNNTPVSSQDRNFSHYNMNERNFPPQNSRKRLGPTNFHEGRLKVQRKGSGSVKHSIDDLSQFILIDSTPLNQTVNELSTLHNSANFNKVVLKLEYENDANGVSCSLLLSDIIVAISHGPTKEEAKQLAVSDSLKTLQECCYTIKIKQAVDSDVSGLTKEQLLSDIEKSEEGGNNVIPDSNIGNMLLRKMGWAGGGCGKDGSGIAEPVKAEMVIGRAGLGLSAEKGIGKNFHERVTNMLQDYIKSDEQKDLHFSSELLKEERAIVHKIGQKLGLKTNSKGKNENRYLIVSRKRSAHELLEHVRQSGGSTSKYDLIPPSDSDYDNMRPEDIVHGHSKQ